MYGIPPLQYLSRTFTCLSKVTLPKIREGFVKVTFPLPFQYLNGSLSKSVSTLKVYFRAVIVTWVSLIKDLRSGSVGIGLGGGGEREILLCPCQARFIKVLPTRLIRNPIKGKCAILDLELTFSYHFGK